MRRSPDPDPLGRLSAADYEAEETARRRALAAPRWLRHDRMYAFPEPTHWLPSSPPPAENA